MLSWSNVVFGAFLKGMAVIWQGLKEIYVLYLSNAERVKYAEVKTVYPSSVPAEPLTV